VLEGASPNCRLLFLIPLLLASEQDHDLMETRIKRLRIMALILVGLQIGDVVSTNHSMGDPRIIEANPITRYFMQYLGSYWWLLKFAPVLLIVAAIALLRRVSIITFAATAAVLVFYGAVVLNNIFHIALIEKLLAVVVYLMTRPLNWF
jgi:Domain of unknown function (DUF5658)